MEQRIGSSSQPLKGEPVTGAGFDPAFIPGLTPPVSDEPEEADAEGAGTVAEDADTGAATGETGAGTEAGAQEPAEGEDGEEIPEGPVFEAADRRAKIVADHAGVRLTLDDQGCEFRWDEIGAVETASPRFGKRFTVTVHTPDTRWYPIEIEADARSRFEEWESQLDAVLDAYFEEGVEEGAEEGESEAEPSEDEGPQDTDTTAEDAKDGDTGAGESAGAKDPD
ncbi:hypothetical protein ACIRPX_10860 [Streptomyces sp. NPDC101225]|uniref:hypothetical protein n=1 Tax=Streptomyces sp. NPDC101225 TaxID=3366135 RepID=UPI00380A2E71